MVEFRFDIKPLFLEPIVKVSSNLLPHTFRGDRRQCLDATSKMSEIIDRLGELSATAQKLNHPVTTAQRLRMADNQIIYLMADVNEGHNGAVIGLLKVGTKDLYLFDETGQTRKVDQTPCILDFYIHESRQRAGLGKQLFETMLLDQQWTALQCSIDRPSDKLLGFLHKHYGLVKVIPQANHFVLYEGFFGETAGDVGDHNGHHHQQHQQINGNVAAGIHTTNSPNTQLFGAPYIGADDHNKKRMSRQQQLDAADLAAKVTQISPAGRYGARRPSCSMAEARKNPLDALSRMSLRHQNVEKRSGLQDVDDEYLKKNVFSTPSVQRHSGLNDMYGGGHAMSQQQMQQFQQQNAAGIGGQQQQQQQQPPPLTPTESTYKLQTGADGSMLPPQEQGQLPPGGQPPASMQQLQGKNPAYKKESHIIHNNNATAKQGATAPNDTSSIEGARDGEGEAEADGDGAVESITAELHRLRGPHGDKLDLETHVTFSSAEDAEIARMPSEAADMRRGLAQQQRQGGGGHNNGDDDELKLEISVSGDGRRSKTPSLVGSESITIKKPTSFKLSKQHTGMKNISFGVGMAVTPTGKMQFDQEAPEEFGVVKINRPIAKLQSPPPPASHDDVDGVSNASSEGLTDQGYHDLKFFHNKLCKNSYEQIYADFML